jgi:hypothetical protein
LAKGLYAGCCLRRPSSFCDIRKYIERESQAYYLDGPNGDDWVARNEIIHEREQTLYVDYIEKEGSRFWLSPEQLDGVGLSGDRAPALVLAEALRDTGCTKPEALDIVARQWANVTISDTSDCWMLQDKNIAILTDMDRAGLLEQRSEEVYGVVVGRWHFPLWGLDLKESKVDKSKLEQERRQIVTMY